MRVQSTLLLAATATSCVYAQEQTDPFFLRVSSTDADVDGAYLGACHSGAGMSAMCLSTIDTPASDDNSYLFYHNYSSSWEVDGQPVGILTRYLEANNGEGIIRVPSTMQLQFDAGTNVAACQIEPGSAGPNTLFDDQDQLSLLVSDDSSYNSTRPVATSVVLQNWYACFTYVGGYYYQALAWVTAGEPHNPSCVSVEVVREFA